jgi:hypothetical protein
MFYKKDHNLVLEAPSVLNINYLLITNNKDLYEYPVDGWYWFDSKEEAYDYFGITLVVESTEIRFTDMSDIGALWQTI